MPCSNSLFRDDNEVIVVGVIGKSTGHGCNKMAGFDMVKFMSLSNEKPVDGEIRFYFDASPNVRKKTLYLHFQTTFDVLVVEQMLLERIRSEDAAKNTNTDGDDKDAEAKPSFHSMLRTKFAQMLLFAIQICHIIVLVEPTNVFDTSYLSIFKALRVIRY